MNRRLAQRVMQLLASSDKVTIATCGAAGPAASIVPFRRSDEGFQVQLPETCDHLFHLQHNPQAVLLTDKWRMQATVAVDADTVESDVQAWYVVGRVAPVRLHILSSDMAQPMETIDFEDSDYFRGTREA